MTRNILFVVFAVCALFDPSCFAQKKAAKENAASDFIGNKSPRAATDEPVNSTLPLELEEGVTVAQKVIADAKAKKFDKQKKLKRVRILCVPEMIEFSKKTFKVKAGQAVKLTLRNPDATAHNLLLLERGASIEEIGLAANEMAKSPEGVKKHFRPDDKRILHATRLVAPKGEETLRFMAPKVPGKYPYVCTFPGHWALMNGVMIVE